MVKAGDKIPSVPLKESTPGDSIDLSKELGSGKSVIVGVPAAFSPACTDKHIPGYISAWKDLKAKSYDHLVVISVNDPFVTAAWKKTFPKEAESFRFLADPEGKFNNELGLLFNSAAVFGNNRSKRYALLVKDGKVVKDFVEPDNTSVNVSDASKVVPEA
ncbi:hypothetical protein PACTADRAFT_39433 [Pachysolen tannophilus NRRL Y-2460]|uniref:Thioredoxin domain-containing protein n=1 Tax=Pachysolen tannophilus NRRL Y-2460 TaxID=669874 RepID=A0A1E4TZY3_PACTA|nr:hypothetical protein PACTADRAFT_39433 [Pachysolen tannophilus NRRL Y-2460]